MKGTAAVAAWVARRQLDPPHSPCCCPVRTPTQRNHAAGGQARGRAAHGAQAGQQGAGGGRLRRLQRALLQEAGAAGRGLLGCYCLLLLLLRGRSGLAAGWLPGCWLLLTSSPSPSLALQLAYILGRHGLLLDLEDGPAAVADEELKEQLTAIMRCVCSSPCLSHPALLSTPGRGAASVSSPTPCPTPCVPSLQQHAPLGAVPEPGAGPGRDGGQDARGCALERCFATPT